MRKKFKSKKKINIKKRILFILIMLLISICTYYILNIKITTSNNNLITILLNNINKYSFNQNNMYNSIKKIVDNKIFTTPVTFLEQELLYKKEKIKENHNLELLEPSQEKNIIYIYNSHQGENYSYEYLENSNIIPNVLTADYMLQEKLKKYNIDAIVEESNILEYMNNNSLDHSGSYIASRKFLKQAMLDYPNAILYIDLHRDAIQHDLSTVVINEKPCAKILFVIGLEHDTYQKNLDIVTKINNIILNKYPTLTRGIMKKEGIGVNGIYNQDLKENVILIEVGGHENNIEEINNTLDLISEIIGDYINEK